MHRMAKKTTHSKRQIGGYNTGRQKAIRVEVIEAVRADIRSTGCMRKNGALTCPTA